jgi:hypothetical protein
VFNTFLPVLPAFTLSISFSFVCSCLLPSAVPQHGQKLFPGEGGARPPSGAVFRAPAENIGGIGARLSLNPKPLRATDHSPGKTVAALFVFSLKSPISNLKSPKPFCFPRVPPSLDVRRSMFDVGCFRFGLGPPFTRLTI